MVGHEVDEHAEEGQEDDEDDLEALGPTTDVASALWVRDLGRPQLIGLALFSATGLPLSVAIVGIGIETGAISSPVGASLIGAGMVSVLVLPLLGIRVSGGVATSAAVGRRSEADEY